MCARCLRTNALHVIGIPVVSPAEIEISESIPIILYRVMAVPKIPRPTQFLYLHIQWYKRAVLPYSDLSLQHSVLQQPVSLTELCAQITMSNERVAKETAIMDALLRATRTAGIAEPPLIMYVARVYTPKKTNITEVVEKLDIDITEVSEKSNIDIFVGDATSTLIITHAAEEWDEDDRIPAMLTVSDLETLLKPSEYHLRDVMQAGYKHRQSYHVLHIALNGRPGGLQMVKQPSKEIRQQLSEQADAEMKELKPAKIFEYALQLLSINKATKVVTVTVVPSSELQGKLFLPLLRPKGGQSNLLALLTTMYKKEEYIQRRDAVWDHITLFELGATRIFERYTHGGNYVAAKKGYTVPNPKQMDRFIGQFPMLADTITTSTTDMHVWGLCRLQLHTKIFREPTWSLQDVSFESLLQPNVSYGNAGNNRGRYLGDYLYFGLQISLTR